MILRDTITGVMVGAAGCCASFGLVEKFLDVRPSPLADARAALTGALCGGVLFWWRAWTDGQKQQKQGSTS